jgi:hypothetical protein
MIALRRSHPPSRNRGLARRYRPVRTQIRFDKIRTDQTGHPEVEHDGPCRPARAAVADRAAATCWYRGNRNRLLLGEPAKFEWLSVAGNNPQSKILPNRKRTILSNAVNGE